MPDRAAMTDKFLTLSATESVESALKNLKKAKVEAAPVVDEEGRLLGLFSLTILMKNLLPVSVPVAGGIMLDVKIPAAPGVAKRLNKIHSLTVGELMDRKVNAVLPETPVWETVNILLQYGAPIVVVDQGSGRALGVVTAQSLLDELTRMKDAE